MNYPVARSDDLMGLPKITMDRRRFLTGATVGAAALGLAGQTGVTAANAAVAPRRSLLMKAGHQHDHTEMTLRALAAFGVKNICSGKIANNLDDNWSVDGLTRLRKHVESFGISLDCVPLPLSSGYITRSEHPEIMLAKDPERDRTLEDFCQIILKSAVEDSVFDGKCSAGRLWHRRRRRRRFTHWVKGILASRHPEVGCDYR